MVGGLVKVIVCVSHIESTSKISKLKKNPLKKPISVEHDQIGGFILIIELIS